MLKQKLNSIFLIGTLLWGNPIFSFTHRTPYIEADNNHLQISLSEEELDKIEEDIKRLEAKQEELNISLYKLQRARIFEAGFITTLGFLGITMIGLCYYYTQKPRPKPRS